MFFTTIKRIIKTGFVNFWRNGFLSFAAIIVITMALLAVGGLIFASAFGRSLLTEVKQQVDMTIYFALSAPESDIQALRTSISHLPEVASTTYVSRDQALAHGVGGGRSVGGHGDGVPRKVVRGVPVAGGRAARPSKARYHH